VATQTRPRAVSILLPPCIATANLGWRPASEKRGGLAGSGARSRRGCLNALAPMQTEPPFAVTQAAVLAIFILITLIAVIKFRPPQAQM
jgi:hypothetical protein